MTNLTQKEILDKLIDNKSLFNNIHVITQKFDILPDDKEHLGASIEYQDLFELRQEFLDELYDTIVDWVYSSQKYEKLKKEFIRKGKSESAAVSEIQRKARNTFRGNKNTEELLIQGQLGELLLFHFIQRYKQAVPILRKMKITTSSKHERFGADAIHFKYENNKPIIILGEAKTYSSNYKFNAAFEDAIESILSTYKSHREEIYSYVHEDFLDDDMNNIAELYIENKLPNVEVHLVSIIVYNETKKINGANETEIKKSIDQIIAQRYAKFDKSKINITENAILGRITYIVFPVWGLDELAEQFQKKI